jgi:hypothetical protein
MKRVIRLPLYLTVFLIIVSCVFLLIKCIGRESKDDTSRKTGFSAFAGSVSCASCHRDVYDSHIHTAHYRSFQRASANSIKGSFEPGSNKYAYNASLEIAMEKRDSGLYQAIYYNGSGIKNLKFDIVVGSGAKGQSYLYWENNHLFQLPVSYFAAADQWSNSPGYPPNRILVDRPVTSRCIECHATFADTIAGTSRNVEAFDSSHIIFGVDCEKCHGPAAEHVAFHTKNPGEKTAKWIIDPRRFTRQQSLDLCALCHGGRLQKTRPSFSFTAGDRLADYFVVDALNPEAIAFGNVDVHGNQYGLLSASKCFTMSNALTCNSCHNSHVNERGNISLFSQRCMNCHSAGHEKLCKVDTTQVATATTNCVDCHMPAQPSRAIAVFLKGKDVPAASMVRSHFISIYPEIGKNIKSKM